MPLDPPGAQGERRDVGRDPQVVSGKADSFAAAAVFFDEALHLQQRQILKGDRIAGDAHVEDGVDQPAPAVDQLDQMFLLARVVIPREMWISPPNSSHRKAIIPKWVLHADGTLIIRGARLAICRALVRSQTLEL